MILCYFNIIIQVFFSVETGDHQKRVSVSIFYLETIFKKFEDIKWVIQSCNSRKDRQYQEKGKMTNNGALNTTQKNKDFVTRTSQKLWVDSDALIR